MSLDWGKLKVIFENCQLADVHKIRLCEIAPSVCQLGRDAVIAWINGQGTYIQATA